MRRARTRRARPRRRRAACVRDRDDRIGREGRDARAPLHARAASRGLRRIGEARAEGGEGHLGQRAAQLAVGAQLSRRRAPPEAAGPRRALDSPLPHRSGMYYLPFALADAVRRAQRRPARRGRQRHLRQHHARTEADDQRRQKRGRALRQLPLAALDAAAGGRLPADPRDALRRRTRRALQPGVVLDRQPRDRQAAELHPVDRRHDRRAPNPPDQIHAVDAPAGDVETASSSAAATRSCSSASAGNSTARV